MHERKKRISGYLREVLEEQMGPLDTRTKNKAIAQELVKLALDETNPGKLRLEAIIAITNRIEGTPVNTNLNAEVTVNPFEGIDTAKLESLREKLVKNETKEEKKPIEVKEIKQEPPASPPSV